MPPKKPNLKMYGAVAILILGLAGFFTVMTLSLKDYGRRNLFVEDFSGYSIGDVLSNDRWVSFEDDANILDNVYHDVISGKQLEIADVDPTGNADIALDLTSVGTSREKGTIEIDVNVLDNQHFFDFHGINEDGQVAFTIRVASQNQVLLFNTGQTLFDAYNLGELSKFTIYYNVSRTTVVTPNGESLVAENLKLIRSLEYLRITTSTVGTGQVFFRIDKLSFDFLGGLVEE